MMKPVFLGCLIIISAISCSQNPKSNERASYKNSIDVKSLMGTWVYSDLVEKRFPDSSARKYFYPISGFSIEIDSNQKFIFQIQYAEQKAIIEFDSLLFLKGRLTGFYRGTKKYIGYLLNYENNTIGLQDFQLYDVDVYGNKNLMMDKKVYVKLSSCVISCSIEQFVLNEIYLRKALNVSFMNKNMSLNFIRDSCSCNGIIQGFQDFSDYQIIDVFKGNGVEIIKLAIYNVKERKDYFFLLNFTEKRLEVIGGDLKNL